MNNLEILESTACLYWPTELASLAAEISTLSPLLETQDEFISVLNLATKSPMAWKDIIQQNNKLTPNLFLKHLMVLSDIGGERLQRFSKDFSKLFPNSVINFQWNNNSYSYQFSQTAKRIWTNKALRVEKSILLENRENFTDTMLDVCMLLLWSGNSIERNNLPDEIFEKCIIGNLIGNPNALKQFIKQRYIIVSRQTAGSTANDLGHFCESFIKAKLSKLLPANIEFTGHTIPNISHNDKNLTTFDLVVQNTKTQKYIGIEISFQVTTNSVIERKAGQVKARQDMLHKKGYKIAYMIDGSGNFQRKNALRTILQYSDCTVNFSDTGVSQLANFIIEATS